MATQQDLDASIQNLSQAITSLSVQLDEALLDLKEAIAAGTPNLTPEVAALSAINDSVAAMADKLKATDVPTIDSVLTASGKVGTAFTYQVKATEVATSFAATGLPAGLAIAVATGLITGTPTAAGVSSVSLTATNTVGTGKPAILIITVAA